MHGKIAKYALTFVMFAVHSACADAPQPFVARDSAGIQILETNRTNRSSAPTIDTAATVRIGDTTATPNPLYSFTRLAGAIRNEDGTVIVADNGATRLKLYDSAGVFVKEVSAPGTGTVDLRNFTGAEKCGSGLLLTRQWDGDATWWTTRGERVGRAKFQLPPQAVPFSSLTTPLFYACSPDSRIIMSGWGDRTRQPSFDDMLPATALPYQSWSKLWIVDTAGNVLVEMPDTIITERIQTKAADGAQSSGAHFFGRRIAFAMDTARTFISYGDKPEVCVYSRDGRLQSIWRAPQEDLTLTAAMLDTYMTAPLIGGDSATRVRYAPYEVLLPRTFPAFDELYLTKSGHLWVRRFRLPWENRVRYGAFSPEGRFLGYTSIPFRREVMEISDNYAVTVNRSIPEKPVVELLRAKISKND